MTREKGIPLVRARLASKTFRHYLNPHIAAVMIADSVLAKLTPIADFMDRMQAVASVVVEAHDKSPVVLVNVPTHPEALFGQIEYHLSAPVKVTLHIVYLDGSFLVDDEEWFPY